jgi:paraquat-inducible protein A
MGHMAPLIPLTGLTQFFHAGHYILLAIVAVFSLMVPLAKMFLVTLVTDTSPWPASQRRSMIYWLSLVGKWSMTDVLIVAILVVVGKFLGVAEVEITRDVLHGNRRETRWH